MTGVPILARWWRERTDAERLGVYTRWSLHGWVAATPPVAALVVAAAATAAPAPALAALVAGSVVVSVTGVRLSRAGFAARTGEHPRPARLLAAAVAVALAVAAAGVLALRAGGEPAPAAAWSVALTVGTVLSAASAAWTTRLLVLGGAATGALAGVATVAAGAPPVAAVPLGVSVAVWVGGVAVAFRLSTWVLEVVEETERTRGVAMQLAVAEERLRFARDLHDVMGRNLSAIAVKSQLAGELVRRQRPGAVEEIAGISRIAEESLREVREVVRGYRTADLPGELAGARSVLRAAGVACTVSGEPSGAALPPPVQAALGWVVREAVTNVLRHSRATEAVITLRCGGGAVELEVVNDGAGGGPGEGAVVWGSGLTGLGERLAAASGRLRAGRDGDRFTVAAHVPVGAAA